MNWLITADIHLSDRPKDAYRFGLFRWLAQQQQKYDVSATFLLGDITQDKDNHSSTLVNRMIDEITELRPPIYIVRGNHDGIDPNNPFFKFINNIEGIHFAVKDMLVERNVLLLPHCHTQYQLIERTGGYNIQHGYVMCHQTFEGAIAETGRRLTGLSAAPIEAMQPAGVWAGDVHRPQTIGCVTYVGAPYAVRFGDDFTPRVLLIKDGKSYDLHYPAPRKRHIRISDCSELRDHGLLHADQIKLTVDLPREKVVNWLKHKREILETAKEMGVEVHGIELKVASSSLPRVRESAKMGNSQLLEAFCKAEKVPLAIREAGLALINDGEKHVENPMD